MTQEEAQTLRHNDYILYGYPGVGLEQMPRGKVVKVYKDRVVVKWQTGHMDTLYHNDMRKVHRESSLVDSPLPGF